MMVLTPGDHGLEQEQGIPGAGRALGHWSWERHLLVIAIGCAPGTCHQGKRPPPGPGDLRSGVPNARRLKRPSIGSARNSLRQIHSFLCGRSPGQMLATAAPWTSPGCHRATSRTSGMPAKRPLMPACEPGPGLASQPRRAWVASRQPVTWPLRPSELAKLMLEVPAARNSSSVSRGCPGGRRGDRHPPAGGAVRRGGRVAMGGRGSWTGRDWHAAGGARRGSPGDHRDLVISAYLPGGDPEHAVRS